MGWLPSYGKMLCDDYGKNRSLSDAVLAVLSQKFRDLGKGIFKGIGCLAEPGDCMAKLLKFVIRLLFTLTKNILRQLLELVVVVPLYLLEGVKGRASDWYETNIRERDATYKRKKGVCCAMYEAAETIKQSEADLEFGANAAVEAAKNDRLLGSLKCEEEWCEKKYNSVGKHGTKYEEVLNIFDDESIKKQVKAWEEEDMRYYRVKACQELYETTPVPACHTPDTLEVFARAHQIVKRGHLAKGQDPAEKFSPETLAKLQNEKVGKERTKVEMLGTIQKKSPEFSNKFSC